MLDPKGERPSLPLSDSLSSVLALGKGRSSAAGVCGALRAVAARVAATALRL